MLTVKIRYTSFHINIPFIHSKYIGEISISLIYKGKGILVYMDNWPGFYPLERTPFGRIGNLFCFKYWGLSTMIHLLLQNIFLLWLFILIFILNNYFTYFNIKCMYLFWCVNGMKSSASVSLQVFCFFTLLKSLQGLYFY